MKIYSLIGIPGSGKTSIFKNIISQYNWKQGKYKKLRFIINKENIY